MIRWVRKKWSRKRLSFTKIVSAVCFAIEILPDGEASVTDEDQKEAEPTVESGKTRDEPPKGCDLKRVKTDLRRQMRTIGKGKIADPVLLYSSI